MSDNRLLFPIEKPFYCQECQLISRIKQNISSNDLPVALQCPECSATQVWIMPPVPRKIDPSKIVLNRYFKIAKNVPEKYHEDPRPLFEGEFRTADAMQFDSEENQSDVPFARKAKRMHETVVDLFKQTEEIEKDLYQFRMQVANHFLMKWQHSQRYKKYWREEYLEAFLEWPMFTFPVDCEDIHSKRYGRWVMSPRFFQPMFGFPVPVGGGFILQLVNQFTRLAFPLEKDEAQALFVPEVFDIEVHGQKLIGPSLPFVWKNIPGLIEDQDATENWISVTIDNDAATRPWLANHGIKPWSDVPLLPAELAFAEVPPIFYETEGYTEVWRRFSEAGRVGIVWSRLREARMAAVLSAKMMRGIKAVFIHGDEDKTYYKEIIREVAASIRTESFANEWVFLTNESDIRWDRMTAVRVCIVDCCRELDTDMIEKLYQFRGRIIGVTTDGLMDFHKENIVAPQVYGLFGNPCFETQCFPVETKSSVMGNSVNENHYTALLASMRKDIDARGGASMSRMVMESFRRRLSPG